MGATRCAYVVASGTFGSVWTSSGLRDPSETAPLAAACVNAGARERGVVKLELLPFRAGRQGASAPRAGQAVASSRARCSTAPDRHLSSANRTPRSSNSSGSFLGLDMTAENLLPQDSNLARRSP